MKLLLLIALTFAGCQGATAQTTECSTVPKASDRLACYDRAMAPTAGKKPDASKTSASPSQTASDSEGQGPLADLLAVENAKLDANIKNICRGC